MGQWAQQHGRYLGAGCQQRGPPARPSSPWEAAPLPDLSVSLSHRTTPCLSPGDCSIRRGELRISRKAGRHQVNLQVLCCHDPAPCAHPCHRGKGSAERGGAWRWVPRGKSLPAPCRGSKAVPRPAWEGLYHTRLSSHMSKAAALGAGGFRWCLS